MGLSVYYKGRLKNASTLKNLIEEVQDIAKNNNWKYFVFEEEFPNDAFSTEFSIENLYGIMITPPESESFYFSFLSNGLMCGATNFNILQNGANQNQFDYQQNSCKTQFAGIEVHKQLILLIDYLNSKYLSDFNCIDEGCFWETRDENILKEAFEKYSNVFDSFSSALEMIPKNEGENLDDYLLRMAEITRQNIEQANNKDTNENDDLPKLDIEQENEFKKLKLNLEFGAEFPDASQMDVSPEIEGAFLDYLYNFERMYSNAEQISVFEKVGSPQFPSAENLNDEELEFELERLLDILGQNNIALDILYEYEDENRLIYQFITEELFHQEIENITMPGLVCHFVYEEFRPNHIADIENNSEAFWNEFLDKENDFFTSYTANGVENIAELMLFRDTFDTFECSTNAAYDIRIDQENGTATAKVELLFTGRTSGHDSIQFAGVSTMNLVYEYGYWYVKHAELI